MTNGSKMIKIESSRVQSERFWNLRKHVKSGSNSRVQSEIFLIKKLEWTKIIFLLLDGELQNWLPLKNYSIGAVTIFFHTNQIILFNRLAGNTKSQEVTTGRSHSQVIKASIYTTSTSGPWLNNNINKTIHKSTPSIFLLFLSTQKIVKTFKINFPHKPKKNYIYLN